MADQTSNFASKLLHAISVIVVLVGAWQIGMLMFEPPSYILPWPKAVFMRFVEQPVYLLSNAWITLKEMLIGLIVGSITGALIALLLSQVRWLERYLMPIVTLMPNLPVFAIAPLLVIWFGLGLTSKIIMTSMIILFPVASAFYDGLKSTPKIYMDLSDSWGATKFHKLMFAQIPAALPSLMTGLKVAATIAPIGAVVGEWVGSAGGLGFVIIQANARVQIDMVFAAVVLIALSAFLLRWIVVQLADRVVWWARYNA